MLLDERTGVEAPPEPPPTRACANCGGELADVQEWCLECGERQPKPGRWTARLAVLVVAGVIVFVGGGTALAYVALRDDANSQSSKILAQGPPPAPAAATTPGTTTAPGTPGATGTPGTTPGTAATPTPTGKPKPPPLIHVNIHPAAGTTQASTNTGTTGSAGTNGNGTTGTGTTGTGTNTGQNENPTTNTKPKRVRTTPKRPPDSNQRYAKGFSPTTAIDFDPLGDGHENPGDVRAAIDRNLATSWSTQDYPNGLKNPVGLFVDAGAQVNLRAVEIATRTPGWGVSIYGNAGYPGAAPPGNGWQLVGQGTVGSAQSAIGLGGAGTTKFQYYLVWITSLPAGSSNATVSEVTLLGAQTRSP
jgi:hypothetical protein